MQQNTVTLIVAGMGIGGTLCASIVGNLFQARGQHQQWRRDNIRRECQELLGQLSVTLFSCVDCYKGVQGGEKYAEHYAREDKYRHDVIDLHRNLGSRILIADEIRKAKVKERWRIAVQAYSEDRNLEKLDGEYESLVEDITTIGKMA
jgi:hypothetical protein